MHYNDNHSVCSNSDNVDEQRHPDYEGGIFEIERKMIMKAEYISKKSKRHPDYEGLNNMYV